MKRVILDFSERRSAIQSADPQFASLAALRYPVFLIERRM
jgi:hypothetical protein